MFTVTKAVQVDSNPPVSFTETFSYGRQQTIDETFGVTTNQQVTFNFTRSLLKCFYMVSDVACTVKTNNNTSPQETFTPVANEPAQWDEKMAGFAVTEMFGGDVTTLYVTTSTTTRLRIFASEDATP